MSDEDKKNTNGWNGYSRLVISELERLSGWCEKIDDKQNKLSTQIAMLNVKSGIWGALGGAIPVVIGLGIWFLKK